MLSIATKMLTLCAVALAASGVSAAIITFTHTGTASGTIGTTSFGPSSFVITSVGNTTQRQGGGGNFFIDHTSSQIAISGLGTFTLTSSTRTFVNQGAQLVGYSRGGAAGNDLFNGPVNAAFQTWDMLSGIGPIGGTASTLQWTLGAVTTNAGTLVLNNGTSDATFTATIPTPGASVAFAAMGLAATRRRRA